MFCVLLLSLFYKSLENHLKVYYDVLKIMPFDTFFSENYNYFFENFE